jgi:hypothetical protein
MSKDRTLSVQMRLRPIRLAFLLRPDDANSTRAVIEANTTRWGGQFDALCWRRVMTRRTDPHPCSRDFRLLS